nr:hypothetical protein Iba_chr03cCG3730 [Ipomoea batatas]GMC77980.1 hypothetical protein Iba_scaffold34739CG0010 [Ipomoea batatas]GMC85282.1 hypothetical protein Iba_scaffold63760CG0010 [Ipomoea batatas]GMD67330.1 hypothetical protein Iba_scaffold1493943CG0010 [Ipomoea batatas]
MLPREGRRRQPQKFLAMHVRNVGKNLNQGINCISIWERRDMLRSRQDNTLIAWWIINLFKELMPL